MVPIALSLIIAVTGSYFLYQWIERQRTPKEVVEVNAEAVPVAVATGDLPWGTKLRPEMIKTTSYLKESLPTGHFASVNDLKGRVLLKGIRSSVYRALLTLEIGLMSLLPLKILKKKKTKQRSFLKIFRCWQPAPRSR
jgi:Flp pilus assembly protein CpaB